MPNLPFLQLLTSTGGGWVIYLLFTLSVLAVAVIIERMIIITRQYKYQESVTKELMSHMDEGAASLERHLETRLSLEKRYLDKRLVILGTLGNNAPFIGLLGTVLGVIRAFHDLGASAGQGPEVVMQGISEALVATAVGILVALPCVAFYNFFQKRVKDTLIDADRFGKELIAVLESKKMSRRREDSHGQ